MPDLDPNDPNLDPVIRAALIKDPEDEEDDKDKKPVKPAEGEQPKAGEDKPEDDKEEPVTPPAKTPVEANDAEEPGEPGDTETPETPDPEKDRAERLERQKKFLDKIRNTPKPEHQPNQPKPGDDDYKPLDYEKADQFKVDDLKQDRDQYGNLKYNQGAQEAASRERARGEQVRFWEKMEVEEKLIQGHPDFQFMNPKNKEQYNEERASVIDNFYLQAIGYREEPLYDPKTKAPLVDPETRQQIMLPTVNRTDLSYEEFVKGFVDTMESFAQEKVDETRTNITRQRSTQGMRPGGAPRKSSTEINPGDISRMSDEEFAEKESEIDAIIMQGLQS